MRMKLYKLLVMNLYGRQVDTERGVYLLEHWEVALANTGDN